MKIHAFNSLEDLNAFLAEMGISALTEEAVSQGVQGAMQEAASEPEPETEPFVFGGSGNVITESAFNDYVEFTSGQIARLVEERDNALAELQRLS